MIAYLGKNKKIFLLLTVPLVMLTLPAIAFAQIVPCFTVTEFATGIPRARDVSTDSAGNVYTMERDLGGVFKISPTGAVSAVANLPPAFSEYVGPHFEPVSGNLFVSRFANFSGTTVLEITPAGVVSVFASGIPDPAGITSDAAGNLYVSSHTAAGQVFKITPSGVVSVYATGLDLPDPLAFNTGGELFIGNRGTNQIMRVPAGGGTASVFASGFNNPTGLDIDSQGNIYVANTDNGTLSKVTPAGVVSPFGSGFSSPNGLAFDPSENLFVANFGSGVIHKVAGAQQTAIFRDDFDGTSLDSNTWDSFPNNGSIIVEDGFLRLSSGFGNTFPFVHTKSTPFPCGNFVVKVRMRYTALGPLGTGLQLARFLPGNNQIGCPAQPTAEYGLPVAAIWQGAGSGLTVSHLDNPLNEWMTPPGTGDQFVIDPGPELNFHTYEFRYVDGIVSIAVDDVTVTTSTTPAERPEIIWLGNPVVCGPNNWTSFEIDFVEVEIGPPPCTPSDPRWDEQWNMEAIDLVGALQEFPGCSPSAVDIAIIDTGADADHPELDGRIISTLTLVGNDALDTNGHGSLIAGIIGANSNNGLGIVGIHSAARLRIYKYANQDPSIEARIRDWKVELQQVRTTRVAALIRAAVDDGAQVINISTGFPWDQVRVNDFIVRPCFLPDRIPCEGELRLAVEYAADHGVVIVAASMNSGEDEKFYPAAYATSHSNVIAVAASTPNGTLWPFSTTGQYVTVAAPGGSGTPCIDNEDDCILSLSKDGGFTERQGTSFAAPHVTGIVALIIAADPSLDPATIRDIIRDTAEPFASPPPRSAGSGIVNAKAAVAAAKP